jgi:enoyl-CoA hydratase
MGLITRVLDDAGELQTQAWVLAERLAANPPMVTAGIKQVLNARIEAGVQSGNHQAATLNGMLMQSDDFAEAMRAFMERRPAAFRGQ